MHCIHVEAAGCSGWGTFVGCLWSSEALEAGLGLCGASCVHGLLSAKVGWEGWGEVNDPGCADRHFENS